MLQSVRWLSCHQEGLRLLAARVLCPRLPLLDVGRPDERPDNGERATHARHVHRWSEAGFYRPRFLAKDVDRRDHPKRVVRAIHDGGDEPDSSPMATLQSGPRRRCV